jgi:hypothetical protein
MVFNCDEFLSEPEMITCRLNDRVFEISDSINKIPGLWHSLLPEYILRLRA